MSGFTCLFSGVVLMVAAATTAAAPPVARVEPVTDTHFGEQVVDRYRWMENDKDPDWLPFLKNQNVHARSVLDQLPLRAELLARIQQLSGVLGGERVEP